VGIPDYLALRQDELWEAQRDEMASQDEGGVEDVGEHADGVIVAAAVRNGHPTLHGCR